VGNSYPNLQPSLGSNLNSSSLLSSISSAVFFTVYHPKIVVTNSINRGTGMCQELGETCTIGSSRYKNLKLKKKEEKKKSYAVEGVLTSG
jgi:hypothetical protein